MAMKLSRQIFVMKLTRQIFVIKLTRQKQLTMASSALSRQSPPKGRKHFHPFELMKEYKGSEEEWKEMAQEWLQETVPSI